MQLPYTFSHNGTLFRLRPCRTDEKDNALRLFQQCEDYFHICGETCPDSADEFFFDLPPGKNLHDKICLALEKEGQIIAVADLVKNYPDKQTWISGLLLIDPKYRRQGLGTKFRTLMCHFAKSQGAKKHRIGVMQNNKAALYFWQHENYSQIAPLNDTSIIRMELVLE